MFALPVMFLQTVRQSLQFGDVNLRDLPGDEPADPDLASVLVLTHDLAGPGGRPVDWPPHQVRQGKLRLAARGLRAVSVTSLLLLFLLLLTGG